MHTQVTGKAGLIFLGKNATNIDREKVSSPEYWLLKAENIVHAFGISFWLLNVISTQSQPESPPSGID